MHRHLTLVLATLALSAAAFAQNFSGSSGTTFRADGAYQIGYAANLNIGDTEINLSNDGIRAGFYGNGSLGNICANVYTFDPQEEEISCCSCLITPNGLNSLSAQKDLLSDTLTPATPTSIVIKLVATIPGTTGTTNNYTVCNAGNPILNGGWTSTTPPDGFSPNETNGNNAIGTTAAGLLAWGTTIEPTSTAGTYTGVNLLFVNGTVIGSGSINTFVPPTPGVPSGEIWDLYTVCSFIQNQGTGYGQCKSCALGALGGAKN